MIKIEKSTNNDLPYIIDIENKSFTTPWSISQITSSLNNLYIAKDDNIIKGFIFIENFADEVHIQHMAVHPDFRRQGIGKLMMEKALSFPANKYFLEVRESNSCARSLYEDFGFKIISKRKKYYQDNDETALVMERNFSL